MIGIIWYDSLVTQRGWRRDFCWFRGFIQQEDGMSINTAFLPFFRSKGCFYPLKNIRPPSRSLNPALVSSSAALKGAKLIVLASEWEVSNMHILILVL